MLTFFKRKWLPYIIAYTVKFAMRIILRTCRIEIQGIDRFVVTANSSPCILMLWHNRMAILPEIMHRNAPQFMYTAFISKSRDGDALAILTKSYSIGKVLRVPHNARHQALNKMISQLKTGKEVMLITPDGPRGPPYVMKPGIVMAAKEAKAKIIPFSWNANRFWQLSTWDKMMIPKPFSKINVSFGDAISLPKGNDDDKDFAINLEFLQEKLLNNGQSMDNNDQTNRPL